MHETHQRDTFLSCKEMLLHEAQRCRSVQHELEAYLETVEEPYAGALRQAAELEDRLPDCYTPMQPMGPRTFWGRDCSIRRTATSR